MANAEITGLKCFYDSGEVRLVGAAGNLLRLCDAMDQTDRALEVDLERQPASGENGNGIEHAMIRVRPHAVLVDLEGPTVRIAGDKASLDRLSQSIRHMATRRPTNVADHVHFDSDVLDYIQPSSASLIVEKLGA